MSGITMIEVQSSQIVAIGHDPETNTLAIRFWNGYGDKRVVGSLYHYQNFNQADFEAFQAAESKGTHFGKFIRHETTKHPYTKIDERAKAA